MPGVGCTDHRHRTTGQSPCLQKINATSTEERGNNKSQIVFQIAAE